MKKIEEASFFYEISETLNEHLELKKSLYKVLDILSSSLDMARGTITLLDPVRKRDPHRSGPRHHPACHAARHL